jgi:Arc/MetJ-type ribon-helix-helix transcriptional regulator
VARTQVILTEVELDLLDRASRGTGASRSELIRRAVRAAYGSGDRGVEERLAGLRAARGLWRDRPFTGEEYVRAVRSGDMNANLRRLGVD